MNMKFSKEYSKIALLAALITAAPAYAAVTSNSSSASGTVGGNSNTGSAANSATINNTTNVNTGTSSSVANNPSNSWNTENAYWKNNYPSRPYYNSSRDYTYYEPAYRYGVDMYNRNQGKSYDELSQSDLSNGWMNARGKSSADWSDVQMATRDAYNRMYESKQDTSVNGKTTLAPAGR